MAIDSAIKSAKVALKKIKIKLYKRSYIYFKNKNNKYFPESFHEERKAFNYNDAEVLSETKCLSELNKSLNYFILSASFADKWFILSFLKQHLLLYKSSRIICLEKDIKIINLFIPDRLIKQRFIFFGENELDSILHFFRPISKVSTQITDSWYTKGCEHTITPFLIKNGLPPGTIRHLHEVYYPYFNELACVHGVSRGILIRTILYLPSSAQSQQSLIYSNEDFKNASEIIGQKNIKTDPFILFNIVNFSHVEFSIKRIKEISFLLSRKKFTVLLNIAESKLTANEKKELGDMPGVILIAIPGNLLALVSSKAFAVIGVLGGAMNIAAQFSNAHLLSFQTPARGIGVPEEELLGKWGKERMWEWWDQDWPCIFKGRVIINKFIGDPEALQMQELASIINIFIHKCENSSFIK
jgi:hypothetical protein